MSLYKRIVTFQMLDALAEGYSVATTADVPKVVACVAGLGPIKLAQHSGRPIYPVAVASHRRIVLDNWDRNAVNLPFSRIGMVAGEPIHVRAEADEAAAEAARQRLQDDLNGATARAYEIVDGEGPQS